MVFMRILKKSVIVFFGVSLTVLFCSQNKSEETKEIVSETDILTVDEFKEKCREIPVDELTENSDGFKNEPVKVSGEVVVYYEESDSEGKITYLIIGVEDTTNTLPSGKLPVYIYFKGSTPAFINDNVTVYGTVFGMDVCPSPQVEDQQLPRIDAKCIEMD